MSASLVSILIPCHNAERWLAATLESALAQTWPQTEIIVVDDGSTDGSLALARTFSARGVRIVAQPNAGASAARNRAFGEAHGEFFQLLDADDLISPRKLAAQIALLATRPADTVASCAWGRFTTDVTAAQFVDAAVLHDFSAVDFLILAGLTGAMMHPAAWLVPRGVAEKAGPWDESLTLNDDGEYFARVALASSGMAFCSDSTALSYYRSGLAGSLSQQRSEQARRSEFHSLELITQHLIAAEDSPRTRQACAGYWRRFVHDFYPAPAELIDRASATVTQLGGVVGPPPMGGKTAALARVLGWKNTRRLKYWLQR